MSNLKNRLNKTADNKFNDLYKRIEDELSEYIRLVALDKLESDPNWNYDINEFNKDFAGVMDEYPEKFKEFTNELINEEVDGILEDYRYNN